MTLSTEPLLQVTLVFEVSGRQDSLIDCLTNAGQEKELLLAEMHFIYRVWNRVLTEWRTCHTYLKTRCPRWTFSTPHPRRPRLDTPQSWPLRLSTCWPHFLPTDRTVAHNPERTREYCIQRQELKVTGYSAAEFSFLIGQIEAFNDSHNSIRITMFSSWFVFPTILF